MINRHIQWIILGISIPGLFIPAAASAHCPLCTAGAGLVAIGAYWIGVNGITVGVLLGAFAVALGLWIGRLIKKKYIPYQDGTIALFSWITTLLPLKVLLSEYTSIYLSWGSAYGRTYPVNLFLVGGIIGGVVISIGPWVSRRVTKARKEKIIPFQGMIVTFALLIVISLITQFVL